MLKRIGLFILMNLAVILVISILLSIFGVQPYLTRAGINYIQLFYYALIVGFAGAIISLLLSKWMAKMTFNIQIIDKPTNEKERWLFEKVEQIARYHKLNMPEVGIYQSDDPNAFATGWNRNDALVAVSTGILNLMTQDELEGVLGHEIAHIANGDMVTMTLLQGVLNTFVIFFARIAAYFVTQFLRGRDNENSLASSFAYNSIAILFQILFGILASMILMWFSRYREFRADAGSAETLGRDKMIRALKRLQQYQDAPVNRQQEAPAFDAMKINHSGKIMHLFSSHPPIEERIARLEIQ